MAKRSESEFETDTADGFKFAVAIIVAFSTVGYNIYNYVLNNPIKFGLFYLISIVYCLSFTIVLGLIVYMVVKGISLEITDPIAKNRFDNWASSIYLGTFRFALWMAIIYSVTIFVIYLPCYFLFKFDYKWRVYTELLIIVVLWIYSAIAILQVKSYTKESNFWKKFWRIDEVFNSLSDKLESDEKYFRLKLSYKFSLQFIIISIFSLLVLFFSNNIIIVYFNKFLNSYINYIMSHAFPNVFSNNTDFTDFYISGSSIFTLGYRILTLPIFFNLYEYVEKELNFHVLGIKCEELGNRDLNIKIDLLKAHSIWNTFEFISLIVMLFAYIGIGYLFFTPYILNTESIKVEMDDIYSSNITNIPIQIVETGVVTNITINLSKIDAEGNLSVLDSIELNPNSDTNKVLFSKYMCVNILNYGKFKTFINTTNMTQGYYQMSFSEEQFADRKTHNSFYLGKSKQ